MFARMLHGLALAAVLLFVVSESSEPASWEAEALGEDGLGLGESLGERPEKVSDKSKGTGK